ncbi:MAG: hypothetical protein LKE41_11175 [Prevotella sp.]|jgi:hypothetical protein|nr:hypothetical protein [Prevotella sp.]MCI2080649.1 hypothetical protein [Prevotella sp.]MCI2102581.1 hypothetical protein [Prevotella sp.]
MRKLLIAFGLFVITCAMVVVFMRSDERSVEQKFREGMPFLTFNTYIDPDFGYQFVYPSFLCKEVIKGYGPGHVQFGYHANSINMVMECKVVPRRILPRVQGNSVKEGVCPDMEAYRYCSHYVCKSHLVYILSFYYPAAYKEAASPILYRVRHWQPFPKPLRLF